jgi:hypothetical protein
MLELISPGLHVDFLGKAKLCIILSLFVILIGLGSLCGTWWPQPWYRF